MGIQILLKQRKTERIAKRQFNQYHPNHVFEEKKNQKWNWIQPKLVQLKIKNGLISHLSNC